MLYVRTIAEETSCSERQARRALSTLEARHLLIRRPQTAPGQGQTFNIYEVYGSGEYVFNGNPTGRDETARSARHPLPDRQGLPCQPFIPPLSDRHNPACRTDTTSLPGGQAPPASQTGPNNVFELLPFNSSKEHTPPTPQRGEERGKNSEPTLPEPTLPEPLEPEPVNPKPQNQIHDTEGKGENPEKNNIPAKPELYGEILKAFNETLKGLPRADSLTPARIKNLERRIREDPAREKPEWWKKFFRDVRDSPWLMGKNPNNWRANFDWLTGESGMRKVVEGNFTKIPGSGFTDGEKRALQRKYTDERGRVDGEALLREWRRLIGEEC
jgi:hypothetical protein